MQRILAVLLLAAGLAVPAAQAQQERASVPTKYTWNLADLYANEAAWRQAKEKFVASLPTIDASRGKLGTSSAELLKGLNTIYGLLKELRRLSGYASMVADQDTRVSSAQAMRQEMAQVATDFSVRTAFVEPEILRMDKATTEGWLKAEPGLAIYRHFIEDVLRQQAHTGTEGEERILSLAGLATGASGNIYRIFSNADFPYPTVKLADGKELRIDASAYAVARAAKNREDRQEGVRGVLRRAGQLPQHLRDQPRRCRPGRHLLRPGPQVRLRSAGRPGPEQHPGGRVHEPGGRGERQPARPSPLPETAPAHPGRRPVALLRPLRAAGGQRGQDVLGGGGPRPDRAGPAAAGEGLRGRDRARLRRALAGPPSQHREEVRCLLQRRGLRRPPLHAAQLQRAVRRTSRTAAHELGHTMQSYYSNKTQPFPTAGYPIFVAEVASTFNEALLVDHMLKNVKDDATRLSILGEYLEGLRGTVFRQTQFAEFELRAHQMAEKGEPLTGRGLRQALPGDHPQVLRARPGGVRGGRRHRPRVGVHPALLSRLLRLPVCDLLHGLGGSLREGAGGGRRARSSATAPSWPRGGRSTRSIC